MARKKPNAAPTADTELAPTRVSKRASTSQFARIRVQKVEKVPEPQKVATKSPKKGEATTPPPKTARRSSSKAKQASPVRSQSATKDEVEKTLDSQNAQVPQTLEEMKRIIGDECFRTPAPVEKTPNKEVEPMPVTPNLDDSTAERPEEPKNAANPRKRRSKNQKVAAEVEVDTLKSVNPVAERSGKRQKREKKIFDPSDSQMPVRKRAKVVVEEPPTKKSPLKTPVSPKKSTAPVAVQRRPTFDTTKLTMIKQKFGQFCYVCLSAKGNLEQTCPRCGSRVHNKCLEEQKYLTSVRILGDDWICQNCCECSVCLANTMTSKTSDDDDEMFVCVTCKKFYHAHCHRPSLTSKPIMKGTWKCHTCAEQLRAQRHTAKELSTKPNGTIDLDLTTVAPTRSRAFTQHKPRNIALKLPPRLNQLHEWTVDEVYRYFLLHFPEHAAMFRDQEIDGAVLLLMRRSDVLQGFGNIKLGVGINIYRHIVMMQTKSNDPRQTWY